MDQERFDRITRTLATGQSRRGFLKGLTGTAIGGLLATVGIAEASAKGPCKAPNTKCGKGKNAVCCSSSQVCNADGTCGARDYCAGVYCPPSSIVCMENVCDPYNGGCYPQWSDAGTSCMAPWPDGSGISYLGTCDAAHACIPND
jgi:hypothetical protein